MKDKEQQQSRAHFSDEHIFRVLSKWANNPPFTELDDCLSEITDRYKSLQSRIA